MAVLGRARAQFASYAFTDGAAAGVASAAGAADTKLSRMLDLNPYHASTLDGGQPAQPSIARHVADGRRASAESGSDVDDDDKPAIKVELQAQVDEGSGQAANAQDEAHLHQRRSSELGDLKC
jgi:hypothetical protein